MCTCKLWRVADKLFLCILCQLISWLHPDDQIILVQFWHIAYSCSDIRAGLILVKVTLFCCLTDTHGYSICCISDYYVFHTEHQSGVRVLHYRIRTSRLLELLKLQEQVCSVMSTEFQISDIYLKDVEDFVLRLVVNKIIYAKIDRPTGVVKPRSPAKC